MPLKINMQTIAGFAEEKVGHKQVLHDDLLKLVSVYRSITTRALASTDADVLKREVQAVLTEALSASMRLLAADTVAALDVASILALERFAILHFVSAQRAFLKGIERVVTEIEVVTTKPEQQVVTGAPGKTRRREDFQRTVDLIDGIDLPYTMTVNPTAQIGPYFKEHTEFLAALLETGQIAWRSNKPLNRCIEIAMHEYKAWASSKTPAACAVRSFLNYEQQQARQNVILDNVAGLSVALKNWIKDNDLAERRQEKWLAYRKTLSELPDDKSTMFDENFGVRKVFVQPTATYRVAGVRRDDPAHVADVAGLLGTLISDRTQSDDLILLCGGPGSGKSTLCRILASELAGNEQVHPVFLRLRRLQESQDVAAFIETHLQQVGLIDKLADLALVPNLVVILDGFDELVMASRTKLREFFNALKDDLSTGPLRHAKAIVSGRDTLFPNGAGLPMGAHVVSLLPFDRPRIAAWGAKWRALHSREEAKRFFPERFVSDDKRRVRDASPLEHLVSWPLTLHLVARAQTSGSIHLEPDKVAQFEKAVLYRSIVADTALRQENQAGGRGRLEPAQMRQFVRAIAWEMYSSGREALDVSEGLPILRSVLPGATDADLAELADVTIVNQPELTKGEETGFEFVHKSFSEYFAAEQIAIGIERVCFQTEQWGADEKTWAMSVHEATRSLSTLFAIRLLTAEVQEMLEPMLDDFKAFLDRGEAGSSIKNVRALAADLERKLQRMEGLLLDFAGGGLLDTVSSAAKTNKIATNPLESFGNFVSALLFLAVAFIRRLRRLNPDATQKIRLTAPALVRMIHIVQGGDIQIDTSYAERGLADIDVSTGKGEGAELQFPPLAPVLLDGVRGLSLPLDEAIARLDAEMVALELQNLLLNLIWRFNGLDSSGRARPLRFEYHMRHGLGAIEYLQRITSRRAPRRIYDQMHFIERRLLEVFDELYRVGGRNAPRALVDEALVRLRELAFESPFRGLPPDEMFERAEVILRRLVEAADAPPRQTRSRNKARDA